MRTTIQSKPVAFIATMLLLSIFWGSCQQQQQKAKPYEATWESLKSHPLPQWFEYAKFGIFIHWGIYSVPAYQSEWYPRYMYTKGHEIYAYHKKQYGPPWEFGYKDFLPQFTAKTGSPNNGQRCLKKQEPVMWYRLPSITMVLPCGIAT